MSDSERRQALAQFLRSRRERLTPADVGMPAGLRRRTPGLRREEVAQVSGVSVTWYTWLEQARDISVSGQVLENIARALKLTGAERRHMFRLAGQPLSEHRVEAAPAPSLQRLVDALDPHPAYLLNANWDLLAWNRSEAGLIGDPARLDESQRNIIRLVFTDPAMRTLLVDWPDQARSLLAQYRADAAQHLGDPRFEELTETLSSVSEEFRTWWDRHDVADFRSARRAFDHPRVGRLTVDYVKLAVLDAPGVKLFAILPADARTAAKLPQLSAPESTGLPTSRERTDFAVGHAG